MNKPSALMLVLILIPMTSISASQSAQESTWLHSSSGIQYRKIEAGCFDMGVDSAKTYPAGEQPFPPKTDELPRHNVCVDTFWLGTHEVTREQWHRVMGLDAPVEYPDRPIAYVTWEAAQLFLQKLNKQQPSSQANFRLPTEAEWEYACHANRPAKILTEATGSELNGLMKVAWSREPERWDPDSRNVGELQANPWGLYDMLGNVWEWTADSYLQTGYQQHQRQNPLVIQDDNRHVIRGGSFKSHYHLVRCGARNYGVAGDSLPTQGLRVVKQVSPQ
tara:strand:- start:7635 stop:8465 length:831 start_codon:yes stop_codon:yes gene_type:complete